MRALAVLGLVLLIAGTALAVEPDEVLEDPALEARAREISKILRCLVCQNQSIDDSDAPLARDLRVLVRERLVAGDDDEAAVEFIVDRYGDFVLLKPPFKPTTYFLWAGPVLVFLLAALTAWLYLRRGRRGLATAAPTPLNKEERRRLKELLDENREP